MAFWSRNKKNLKSESVRSAAPLMRALEPRIMFDASVPVIVDTAHSPPPEPIREAPHTVDSIVAPSEPSVPPQSPEPSAPPRTEVVFVDAGVQDYQQLINNLPVGSEVVTLDSTRDGFAQMAEYLSGRTEIDAVHLISHGRASEVHAGSTWLSLDNLNSEQTNLAAIGSALSESGDFLIYGCNVSQGGSGEALITQLANFTHADIAASSDWTGDSAKGGDWDLESKTGVIETTSLLADAPYNHLLNTLNAGDMVVLGWSAVSDTITFATLVDIPSGAVINITDWGWNSAGSAFTGSTTADGRVTWTTSSNINAGSVFQLYLGGTGDSQTTTLTNITASSSLTADISYTGYTSADPMGIAGDGVFIYQDSDSNPYFIFGFNNSAGTVDASNWNTPGSFLTVRDSTLPGGTGSQNALTNGANAIGVPGGVSQNDNVQYTGATTPADRATWLSRITNSANWTGDLTGTITTTVGVSSGSSMTLSVPPTVTSATYDASTGVLAVTGANMTTGDTIAVNKLTLTGEGGSTYTLTSSNVTASSATAFFVTLNATDKAALNQIANKNGTSSTGGTTFNLAAADDWDANVTTGDTSDTTNGVTVSNVAAPTITSATYDASTGALVVTGAGLLTRSDATNDIVANKFTLRGEGGATYTLTDTANVEVTSGTSFTLTLSATDKAAANLIINKNGTLSTDISTYNLAAAEDWAAGADAAVVVADTTGNNITASNVAVPAITSATYNANTGAVVVTGTGFLTRSGATNDIVANKFTLTGEGGGTYTLTDTANVEVTSGTSFTLTLSATDKAAINQIVNKNGTSSTSGTTYNLAAAEDWSAGADAAVTVADTTGNGVTASNVAAPTITSATYDASTGALVVTGAGLLARSGATNDIVANKFTLRGEGGATYTLTDTANVEITSAMSFTLTLSATDKAAANLIINKNGTLSTDISTYNLAAAEDWAAGADAAVVVADTTGNNITASNVAVPAITSATYNANTGAVVVTGTGFLTRSGATNDIVANKFTFTGEGGSTYTLTDTSNVEVTSGTAFTLTLSATDKAAINQLVNKNGTSSTGGTTYNLAAAEDWAAGADAAVVVADTTGNGVTVSNVAVPAITSATYNANTGAVVVTGTGFLSLNGATNDIVANKFTFTGEGGSTYTLTDTANVEVTSGTAFTLTLSATDKAAINQLINKNGTSSTGGSTYNLAAAEDWTAGADAAVVVADTTGNGVTVSNVAVPAITSATYNANTGAVVVTGTGFLSLNGATNDIVANKFTFTGEGGSTYTLTDTANVEVTSGTAFTLTLSATDKAAINQLVNKNGTSSTGGTTYNLAAAEDWSAGADAAVVVADTTGNGVTVSNVAVPTITSATYNANTGAVVVTGTGFLALNGATNDIVANKFTFTGEGGSTYTLTDTANVEVASGTGFTLTLSATDKAAINQLINKNGTSSTGGTTYNLATAEDWSAGADAAVVVADTTGNGVTVSNVAAPTITSATYNANTGAVVVTGTGFLSLNGATNDIVANKFTVTGEGGATYSLTDTSNVEITSGTSFTLTLSATDKSAINQLVNKNGTSSTGGTTYNFAAAEDWAAGADAAVVIADLTGNGVTASNVAAPTITSAAYDFSTGSLVVTGAGFLSASGATNDIVANKFTFTGEGGATYTLTDTSNVEITSGTSFTLTLGATDKAAVNVIINKNGASSNDATTYNLAAAEDWAAGANVAVVVADLTGNGVTASNVGPTASIVVADTALAVGETSLVTFTFSQAVAGLTNADLTIANGTLSAVSSSDGGITWTATFTPTASITDATNVISLDMTGVTSVSTSTAGMGTANSNNYAIDTSRPTATIVVADTALAVGETSLVTITFSEAVTGFANADLTIANGTLSAVSSSDGGVTWTATFTPTAAVTDPTNLITLDNTGVQDAAGNAGTGTTDSNNYAIDAARPTATITVADNVLAAGETSLVTITFSEAVIGFANADLTIANGTLGAVSSSDGGVTWTATLTPTAAVTDPTNLITLDNTGVQDAAGNAGAGTTDSNNYAIDTARPTATIVVADTALAVGETSLVTITFSEAVTGFTNTDLTIANGTLSAVSSSDGGVTWTATFTPTVAVTDPTNLITLDNTGVQDAAGNAGAGTTDSNNYAIETARPTATIVVADNALAAGETSLVTITFSEAVTGFTNVDLTIANGTLSAVSSSDGGVTWTATLTPTAAVTDPTNLITLDNTGVQDAAGNAGTGTTDSNNYAIDAQRPTATVVVTDTSLTADETSLVTITFSEAVTGFTNADLTVANGTLSAVSSSDGGVTWTATLTPTIGVNDPTNVITLDNTGVQDVAGNAGAGTTDSNNYAIDTEIPIVTSVSAPANATYLTGQNLDFTVNLSEAANVDTSGGTPRIAITLDGGAVLYANYLSGSGTNALIFRATVQSGQFDNNGITVGGSIETNGGSIRDTTGNDAVAALNGVASTTAVLVDALAPTVASVEAVRGTGADQDKVIFIVTFSEAVTGVNAGDFALTLGQGLSGSIGAVTQLSASVYAVTVDGVQGSGTMSLSLNAVSGITDLAGNAIPGGQISGLYSLSPVPPLFADDKPAAPSRFPDPFPPGRPQPLILLAEPERNNTYPRITSASLIEQTSFRSGIPETIRVPVNASSRVAFMLPFSALGRSDTANVVQTRMADGRPLPAWLRFDPVRGVLEGQPPSGFTRLLIEIIVTDAHGNRVSHFVDLSDQGSSTADSSEADVIATPAGKPALQEQFARLTMGAADHLWRQLQVAAENQRSAESARSEIN
jgi:trimeric autotransporter adhesin